MRFHSQVEEAQEEATIGKRALIWALAGGVAMLLVLAAAGLIVVMTGSYDVAATSGHRPSMRWALDTTMRNSVQRQAEGLRPPERMTAQMITAGAGEYKAMCAHCHAGPGIERAGWAQSMTPQPPHLTEAAAEWAPHEIFWIVRHGIKMTGMPAFGPTHDDATLWNIAAFVSRLPGMTPEQYAAFPEGHGAEPAEAGQPDDGHSH